MADIPSNSNSDPSDTPKRGFLETELNYLESELSVMKQQGGLIVDGLPQPSDEILNLGDVISITFNRELNAGSVEAHDIRLTDLQTGERLDVFHAVTGRKITITPDAAQSEIQNRLLQVSVSDISDQTGNDLLTPVSWKFRVRQNPISWDEVVLRESVLLGDQTTLTATLSNQGAVEEMFSFSVYPDWLTPSVLSGTLLPGEQKIVAFSPDPNLGAGMYRDTVIAETSLGNENLVVEYAIQCEPPAWELDEAAFSNIMNLVASFYVGDVPFSSENDIVAAFVGDELRGVTRVVPTIPAAPGETGYLYAGFMTIHSNQTSGEEVSFKLWDAAACRVMEITDTIPFESDAVIGSAESPQKLTISGAMLQSIPVVEGTNWISFGVEATNMSLNNFFSRTRPQEGDVVIGQNRVQPVHGRGLLGGNNRFTQPGNYV